MIFDNWTRDPLNFIDGCTDGTVCPDADTCRRLMPENCPLFDDQFELPADLPLDKVISSNY